MTPDLAILTGLCAALALVCAVQAGVIGYLLTLYVGQARRSLEEAAPAEAEYEQYIPPQIDPIVPEDVREVEQSMPGYGYASTINGNLEDVRVDRLAEARAKFGVAIHA